MDVKNYRKFRVIALFLLTMFLWMPLGTPAASAQDDVSFSIEPYLWLPSIGGELNATVPTGSTGNASLGVDPDDYFSNLEMAFLLNTTMRMGKWSLGADFLYMDISGSSDKAKSLNFGGDRVTTSLNSNTNLDLKTFMTTFGGGYQIVNIDWMKMDLVAGIRYLKLEADLDGTISGTVSGSGGQEQSFSRAFSVNDNKDFWNGIGGVRGKLLLGDGDWFIPFFADIGAGDSDLTWQIFAALGYSFSDWFNMVAGYRYLDFDNGDDAVVKDLNLGGPVIGFDFVF